MKAKANLEEKFREIDSKQRVFPKSTPQGSKRSVRDYSSNYKLLASLNFIEWGHAMYNSVPKYISHIEFRIFRGKSQAIEDKNVSVNQKFASDCSFGYLN